MVGSEGNMSVKNPVTPPGIDPGTVRLVGQHLNHYAIQAPYINMGFFKKSKRDCTTPTERLAFLKTVTLIVQFIVNSFQFVWVMK
jgi:hypothetical protein